MNVKRGSIEKLDILDQKGMLRMNGENYGCELFEMALAGGLPLLWALAGRNMLNIDGSGNLATGAISNNSAS